MVLKKKNGNFYFDEQLVIAIKQKNNDKVQSALVDDDKCKARDSGGATPLHFASAYGNNVIIRHLISHGVNVNAQDELGRTPLLLAVTGDNEEISAKSIELLLEANADFLLPDHNGKYPLQYIVDSNKFDVPSVLLDVFIKLKEYCHDDAKRMSDILVRAGCLLEAAVMLGNSTVIDMMIKAGWAVNAAHPIGGHTALHMATTLMNEDIVRVLIENGADATAKFGEDDTLPLTMYLQSGALYPRKRNREIMKLLMRQYFGVANYDADTERSIFKIFEMGDEPDLRYALEFNVDCFSMRDADLNSPLHFLGYNPNRNVTRPLQGQIVDVNLRNRHEASPLHHAAAYCYPETVQFLLDNGAEVDAKNEVGCTPLASLVLSHKDKISKKRRADQKRVLEMLLCRGANIQVIFHDNLQTPKTIFESEVTGRCLELAKPLLARIAFIEKLGNNINDLVRSKINAHRVMNNEYQSCKRQLQNMEKIVIDDTISLFALLQKSEAEIIKGYVYSSDLLDKFDKYMKRDPGSYYYEILRTRVASALLQIKVIQRSVNVILNKFTPTLNDLVAHNILRYLDYQDINVLNKI